MTDFKGKYYLVEYYDGDNWLGTTIICAINSAWALTIAATNYSHLFNDLPKESIIIDTVDDIETEKALEFETYEEAEKYLNGGYGRIYDKSE